MSKLHKNFLIASDIVKPSILIIDDDSLSLSMMATLLESQNYTVLVAEDGAMGLQRAKYSKPDLIILDILMPEIDGYEVCCRLKKNKETRDIPVIFMTSLVAIEEKVKGLAAGAVDFITKPYQREEVLARIGLHIRLRETTKRLLASNKHLETLFSCLPDGLFTVDADQNVLFYNSAAEQIYGPAIVSLPLSCKRAIDECLRVAMPVTVSRHDFRPADRRRLISITITVTPLKTGKGVCSGAVVLTRDETLLDTLEQAITTGGTKLIGEHPKIKEVYDLIMDCSKVDSTVLIQGESGTGKELVANLIQENSLRSGKPFVKVNCAGISESLIESEVFGHVRGAFTDAHADRVGRFEMAEGGTIFLDEIGDISPQLQIRLLRVLENRQFERVGESITRPLNVRVIAASNSDLEAKVAAGQFRKDLFYRLNVIAIKIPPLRERSSDIPLLVNHFIKILSPMLNKKITITGVSPEVMQFITTYQWDGNIRELKNTLEYAMVRTQEAEIKLNNLPEDIIRKTMRRNNPAEMIQLALKNTGGNKAATARVLGIDRGTLYDWIKKHNIEI